MEVNLPAKIRTIIYLLSVFVNATLAVVLTEVTVNIWVLGVVAGLNALVALLAKSNVTPDSNEAE